jgi:hypothetical protein
MYCIITTLNRNLLLSVAEFSKCDIQNLDGKYGTINKIV